jgi:hypothetical protein
MPATTMNTMMNTTLRLRLGTGRRFVLITGLLFLFQGHLSLCLANRNVQNLLAKHAPVWAKYQYGNGKDIEISKTLAEAPFFSGLSGLVMEDKGFRIGIKRMGGTYSSSHHLRVKFTTAQWDGSKLYGSCSIRENLFLNGYYNYSLHVLQSVGSWELDQAGLRVNGVLTGGIYEASRPKHGLPRPKPPVATLVTGSISTKLTATVVGTQISYTRLSTKKGLDAETQEIVEESHYEKGAVFARKGKLR